jgi:hypothetical protein
VVFHNAWVIIFHAWKQIRATTDFTVFHFGSGGGSSLFLSVSSRVGSAALQTAGWTKPGFVGIFGPS